MWGERLMICWHAALCRPSRATWFSSVDLACQADVPADHVLTQSGVYGLLYSTCIRYGDHGAAFVATRPQIYSIGHLENILKLCAFVREQGLVRRLYVIPGGVSSGVYKSSSGEEGVFY